MLIIGIDCAVNPKNVGLAIAQQSSPSQLTLRYAQQGLDIAFLKSTLAKAIDDQIPVLLAIDAPLGWPRQLGPSLQIHQAGQPLQLHYEESGDTKSNLLFRRFTDRYARALGYGQPLDVGADKIARASISALDLLAELQQSLRRKIALSWSPTQQAAIAAIEVYPAATLRCCGLPARSYKRPGQQALREEIIQGLRASISIPEHLAETLVSDKATDALDAVVCLLSGLDFLQNRCVAPDWATMNKEMILQEGWMWIRAKE